jgi:hypothetical protein
MVPDISDLINSGMPASVIGQAARRRYRAFFDGPYFSLALGITFNSAL